MCWELNFNNWKPNMALIAWLGHSLWMQKRLASLIPKNKNNEIYFSKAKLTRCKVLIG
jgi:hypothetical protein